MKQYGDYSPAVVIAPADPAMRPWPFNPLQVRAENQSIVITVSGFNGGDMVEGWSGVSVECFDTATGELVQEQTFDALQLLDDGEVTKVLSFNGLTNGHSYTFQARQYREV